MLRRGAYAAAIVVLLAGGLAALNRVVDPRDEFYSGDALTEALASHCLLGDDVVHARSYLEFKRDLFRRSRPTRIVLGSNERRLGAVNMSFPGFGPHALLETLRGLERETPAGTRLRLRITTTPAWFNTASHFASSGSDVVYLLSPWTLASTLDLMRRSRTLAFSGRQKELSGGTCVVDRGSPQPAWRADGTFTGSPRTPAAWRGFAFTRLDDVDEALAIARRRGWRVVGTSEPGGPPEYAVELRALFAKYGYRWRARTMPV